MAVMKALRILDWERTPEVVDVVRPDPGPGQVRVRVAGCGLCHSDLTMAAMPAEIGRALGWSMPFTLGHEVAGWVDGVGTGVTGWADGDPVALTSPASCGTCRRCRSGFENACVNGTIGRGYGLDGGAAEYVIVEDPARALVPLGTLDPATAGPLTDAGATSHHAVARIAPRVGADAAVVVIGAGGLGAYAIQLARALTQASVVAVDPDERRRDLAVDLGADLAIDGVDRETRDRLAAAVNRPVDAVIDVVGSDATLDLASRIVEPGGAIAVVGADGGTLRRPWYGGLPRDAEIFTFQGSDLADVRGVIDLAAAGRLRSPIVPFPLADAPAALEALAAGGLPGRVVLHPMTR